jgi:hypothetical protein
MQMHKRNGMTHLLPIPVNVNFSLCSLNKKKKENLLRDSAQILSISRNTYINKNPKYVNFKLKKNKLNYNKHLVTLLIP